MKSAKIVTLGLLGWFSISNIGYAHSRFLQNGKLALRNTNDGNKAGPCGAGTRNANPTVLKAGSTLTVEWEETVQHPGYFLIQFAPAADTGFEANQLTKVIDIQDLRTDLPHKNSVQITLPTATCEDCTLRLIQAMTEVPATPTFYYSCADIKLVKELPVSTSTATSTATKTATSTATATKTDTSTNSSSDASKTDTSCK